MCGVARRGNTRYFPGQLINVDTPFGEINLKWGADLQYYNARSEKFYTTWRKFNTNRCIFNVDEFEEKNGVFIPKEGGLMKLACIYNRDFFMVLTKQSTSLVAQFHHRMPIIVNGYEDYYFNEERIDFGTFNYELEVAA